MFGVHIPSISDVKDAVTGAASTARQTTENLDASAVSHAASLGRSGLDLGRTAVNAVSHVDVQKFGSTVTGGIGKAEHWAEGGIQTGVLKAGGGVHAAANYARDHVPGGDNPISDAARGAITAGEDLTRFDIGVVGGVGKAAVRVAGSVGQLGVLSAEYQASPAARQAIDAFGRPRPRPLEQALGLPKGQLNGSALVRIDFEPSAMDDLHVRMPSGNEAGANEHGLPGGLLPSGLEEAVLYGAAARSDQYSISEVK